jgi:riboflavin synthase alpha subunit
MRTWFEVWLIPETLRMTTFADKAVGAALNVEIDRATQVVVDTVRDALAVGPHDAQGSLLGLGEAGPIGGN